MNTLRNIHLQGTRYKTQTPSGQIESRLYVKGTSWPGNLALGLISLRDDVALELPDSLEPRHVSQHTVAVDEADGTPAVWFLFKQGTPDPLGDTVYKTVNELAEPHADTFGDDNGLSSSSEPYHCLQLTQSMPYPYQNRTKGRCFTATEFSSATTLSIPNFDEKLQLTSGISRYIGVDPLVVAAAALETVATLQAADPDAMSNIITSWVSSGLPQL